MEEGFSRRDFIKKAAMTGAAAMMPEVAQSAEKEKTREEQFVELKDKVADIKERYDTFKKLGNEDLKVGVAKKFLPEMLDRIKRAKDDVQVAAVYWALAERGTEHIHQINVMYASLGEMEKEMRLLLGGK